MMRSKQLGNPLKHIASCIKCSRFKESVKYCRFVFSGVILKSPTSNSLWDMQKDYSTDFLKIENRFGLEVCMCL